MKITKSFIKKIIHEELQKEVEEFSGVTRTEPVQSNDPNDPLSGGTNAPQQNAGQVGNTISKDVVVNIQKQLNNLVAEINKVLGQ